MWTCAETKSNGLLRGPLRGGLPWGPRWKAQTQDGRPKLKKKAQTQEGGPNPRRKSKKHEGRPKSTKHEGKVQAHFRRICLCRSVNLRSPYLPLAPLDRAVILIHAAHGCQLFPNKISEASNRWNVQDSVLSAHCSVLSVFISFLFFYFQCSTHPYILSSSFCPHH